MTVESIASRRIEPRGYQHRAINDSRAKIAAGIRRICLNSPTGSGKTVIAAGVVQLAVAKVRLQTCRR